MSLFDSLANGGGQGNPQAALQSIKADPAGVLSKAGYNVPRGMNDPGQIINHLLSSGQVGGPRLQMAQALMRRMGGAR